MVKYLEDRPSSGRTPRKLSPSGSSTPFVGRDDELRRLAGALTFAAQGQGRIVFLSGRPGIGKTRLAREALALARARHFTTLEGRCHPLEAGLSYAPFVEAFNPLLRNLESAPRRTLVDGLPSLGLLFEGLCLPPPSFSERLGDPGLEKTRLFEAMSRLLERLAQSAPVALFVDDLHRADPATLDLLYYLAQDVVDQQVLLLANYSTDCGETNRGVRGLIVSLQRDGLVDEIVVPRLAQHAVDMLVRAILGGEALAELLVLLEARAAGTPLFVETLLSFLIESAYLTRNPSENGSWVLDAEGNRALPPSIRRLILDRLDRLGPMDRRVIEMIAVIGDATAHTTLRTASSLDEEALVDSLRRLKAMGLIVEGMDGLDVTYGITHPLIQEVAYAELPEMERRRVHLRAIRALESFSDRRRDHMYCLARHYQGAGSEASGDRALAALAAAGEHALNLYANEEAARHFEAALAILREGSRFGAESGGVNLSTLILQPLTLSHLLERLGEARHRIGKLEAAIEAWHEALAEEMRSGDALAASRLRRQLALAEWDRGRFDAATAHMEVGFSLLTQGLPEHEHCQELADLHYARSYLLGRLGDAAGIAATATELLTLAGRLATPRAEAEANMVAALACLWQGDVSSALERARHALREVESFPEGRDLALCWRAHAVLETVAMYMGDHHLMRYHSEQCLTMAQRLGVPSLEVHPRVRLSYANLMAGGWNESLRHGMEAIDLARQVGQPLGLAIALAGRAVLLAMRGEVFEAMAYVAEVRTTIGTAGLKDRTVISLIDIAETAVALERGQAQHAVCTASGFVHLSVSEGTLSGSIGLTLAFIPMGLMLLAEAQVAARDPKSALETASKIGRIGSAGSAYPAALASRAEGLARQLLGQQDAAIDCLARAHQVFVDLEMPFEAARSLLNQASAAAALRRDLAVKAAQQSLVTFERLGAQRYADRARRLLRQFGIAPLATVRPQLGRIRVSERELQIAQLVAEGLTIAEIAKRLTLSPLKVSSHRTCLPPHSGRRSGENATNSVECSYDGKQVAAQL